MKITALDVLKKKKKGSHPPQGGPGGGGGVTSPKSYVDVPTKPRKSDFLCTNFSPNYPPITIFYRKAPNFAQIGCSLQ